MKKIRITAEAVILVNQWAGWAEPKIGAGYVPVITWLVMDTGDPDFAPHLGIAFEKSGVVDRSRAMQCDGKEVEIFQYVPDELFGQERQKFIDVVNNELVLAEDSNGP
ncbi:MAG: hypothetical protein JOY64_01765 [Alphaproteobacteria bacterium]|nr:hypothetical protein [Alphaproteobacteria bacterium]